MPIIVYDPIICLDIKMMNYRVTRNAFPDCPETHFSLQQILYYFQSGSFFQSVGNPIAATSTLG